MEMLEFLLEDRCTGCNKCYEICPQDVFDAGAENSPPIIARLDDCHSCRQCALHCPVSAIHVSLLNKPTPDIDREVIISSGRLTRYAEWLGWKDGKPPAGDRSYGRKLREARGMAEPDPSDRVRRQLHDVQERNFL